MLQESDRVLHPSTASATGDQGRSLARRLKQGVSKPTLLAGDGVRSALAPLVSSFLAQDLASRWLEAFATVPRVPAEFPGVPIGRRGGLLRPASGRNAFFAFVVSLQLRPMWQGCHNHLSRSRGMRDGCLELLALRLPKSKSLSFGTFTPFAGQRSVAKFKLDS